MVPPLVLPVALLCAAQVTPAPERKPQFVRPAQQARIHPLWVPVDRAFSPEGQLRTELFSESDRRVVMHQSSVSTEPVGPFASEPECKGGVAAMDRFPPTAPTRTIAELSRAALRIAVGIVRSATPGFYDGLAGTLLEIGIDENLKGRFTTPTIYVFYPFARHRRGRVNVCRADFRYNLRPQSGDQVLFFNLYSSRDAEDTFFEPRPTDIMLGAADGTLRVEPDFRDAAPSREYEEVVGHVRQLSRETETR